MESIELTCNLCARKIRNLCCRSICGAFFDNDNKLAVQISVRKVNGKSSVFRGTHPGDNHINLSAVQCACESVPFDGLYNELNAKRLRYSLCYLNVITVCICAIVETDRRIFV